MRVLRRLRGALGNALLWGASWFVASFGLWTALHLFAGVLPMPDPWLLIFYISASSGVTGFITGVVFSTYLRLAYWERSILDIGVGRFALGGAAIAGSVFVAMTLFGQAVTGLSFGLPDLLVGGIWPTFLGGLTAGGSIRAAQHASRHVTGAATDQLEREQREALAILQDGGVSSQSNDGSDR